MNDRYEKYSWLELALSEQVDRVNESYYFDRRDNEFFSVFITDYFLTDPSSTDNYPYSPYSATELEKLTERIERLELHDTLILSIPRLTIEERIQMMKEFLESRPHLKNYDELQTLVDTEKGRTNLDFGGLLQNDDREEWKQFKSDIIEQKIDTFCTLQNIHLDTATLSTDKKLTTVSLGIDNNIEEKTKEPKKPWWKFW